MSEIRQAVDAYAPQTIAELVESGGVRKANLPTLQLAVLGVLAGVFIAFGAMFYTVAVTNSGLGFGITRIVGGLTFSLGLILVVVGGAELFTGNNLITIAWASRKVSTVKVLRNWSIVYLANFAGALACAYVLHASGTLNLAEGAVGETASAISAGKLSLGFEQAFIRGVLCNALVCLAIWLTFASHTVSGKILAIVFPITTFVAIGFEHCVANMYLIPVGMLARGETVDLMALAGNLVPVTASNIIGGAIGVALVYWTVYLRRTLKILQLAIGDVP